MTCSSAIVVSHNVIEILTPQTLLVGETGTGKTSVIQALASAVGATLVVQNLNIQV